MTALANKFRVAVYDEFLDAFAALPRAQQKKVSKFMRKFRANPTDASINYEGISTFKDPNMRTVRIDQAYRAVVLKPEHGNVYVLLWVDNHDEAMNWAKNKQLVIHPETGALQMLSATKVEAPAPEKVSEHPPPDAKPLFRAWDDVDLTGLGIPEQLLPAIRDVRITEQLEAMSQSLPEAVYEALAFLAMGEPLEAVRDCLGLEKPKGDVDTEDFATALENVSTQRHFRVVDDAELEAMLDENIEKWRIYLHPSQRRLVRANFNGPARVLGGAGTGKTVVAMHRARYLLTEVFTEESDRILFTTFTTNLAEDIRGNLQKLCPPPAMARIEIVPLDEWVNKFLRSQGYEYRIAYWGGTESLLEELWSNALAVQDPGVVQDDSFYREEWDAVVQPAGCQSFDDYKKASRVGRGKRISRQQRKLIWRVFEEYRNLLEAKNLREPEDAMRDAAALLRKLGTGKSQYRAVIIDEAQDMSTSAFDLLRSIIPEEQPNDLFIVGDGHQRIYRREVVLKQAGVNIVGRSRKLYVNYRTTDEIRRYAVAVLRDENIDDLDGGKDDNSKYKSLIHGIPPDVKHFDTFAEEVDGIRAWVAAHEKINQLCLVGRTHRDVEQYEAALNERDVETYRLRRRRSEDRGAPGLRIATTHRVKGLEFDGLIIAGCNEGRVPLATAIRSSDRGVKEEAIRRERALFYVAATRARREVLITSYGTPSPWVAQQATGG